MSRSQPRPPVTDRRGLHLFTQEEAPPTEEPTATVLLRRALAGDGSALEALLVEAQEVAWRFSMTVCGHAEDAEDAMQDALVRTYRKVSQIRDPEAFRPWLYRTVRNACLMSRRRRVQEPKTLLSIDDLLPDGQAPTVPVSDLPSPEDAAAHARLRRQLNAALAHLPPAFRAVVFLRDMEGLSTREAAISLGISEDNVKARLHRARLMLRKSLSEPKNATRRASARHTR